MHLLQYSRNCSNTLLISGVCSSLLLLQRPLFICQFAKYHPETSAKCCTTQKARLVRLAILCMCYHPKPIERRNGDCHFRASSGVVTNHRFHLPFTTERLEYLQVKMDLRITVS